MVKLYEYNDWKSQAITHWEQYITDTLTDLENSGAYSGYVAEPDIQACIDALHGYMDAFDVKVDAYLADDSRRVEFIGALFALSSFISSKYITPTPEAPVHNLPSVPNNTTRDLFCWWSEDLPDYTNMFQLLYDGDPEPPGADPVTGLPPTTLVATLATTTGYSAASDAFDGYIGDDIAKFEQVSMEVPNAIRESVAYMFFAGAEAEVIQTGKNIKDVLLNEFEVNVVLDHFNWQIKGIN